MTGRLRAALAGRFVAPAITLFAAVLLLLDVAAIARTVRGNPSWRTTVDFGLYLKTAHTIAGGGDPYDYRVAAGVTHHAYAYPPLFAEIIVPLAQIGDDVARLTWIAISAACLIASVVLLLRGFGHRVAGHWLLLVLALLFATFSVRDDLYHGQANFALLLLIVVGAWLLRAERPRWAGMAWGLMFVIKPFLGVLVVFLLLRRQYRAAATSAATALLLFVGSFLVMAPQGLGPFRGWIDASRYDANPPFTTQMDNYALRGVLERLFSTNGAAQAWTDSSLLLNGLALLLVALLVAAVLYAIPRGRRDAESTDEFLLQVGFFLAAAMTYGPLTEGDHLFLLLPGLAGALFLASSGAGAYALRWRLAVALAWIALMSMLASPVLRLLGANPFLFVTHPQGIAVLWTGRIGFLLLAVTVISAFALRHERRATNALAAGTPGPAAPLVP